jgi:hypothetical protein
MIHVDAPSLLFIGLALHLLSDQLPSRPGQAVILGALLALAGWTKQSTWPFIPALLAAMCSLFGWRTAFKALNGLILTSLLLLSLLWIVESPSEMTRMIWHLPLSQTSVTSVTSALLLFLREGWPVLILPTVFVAQIFLDKNSLLEISHPCLLAKFLIALWMIPFAILTRTKLGADSNHLALPLFCILMASAPLLPKIADTAIFNRELYPLGSLIYLALLLLPALSLHAYLATNCSWYLWNHNSQQQAMERLQHPHQGLYLPWQILPMLIADGRLYHLDDCLRYENGMGWRRSRESLARFLPNPLTEIAIRPFGAPSYLAAPALPNHAAADLMLPGWATFHPRTFPQ